MAAAFVVLALGELAGVSRAVLAGLAGELVFSVAAPALVVGLRRVDRLGERAAR